MLISELSQSDRIAAALLVARASVPADLAKQFLWRRETDLSEVCELPVRRHRRHRSCKDFSIAAPLPRRLDS